MSADTQDKFISIIQEIVDLWAVSQEQRRVYAIEVSSSGQDKRLASIIWTVWHLSAGTKLINLEWDNCPQTYITAW